MICAPIIVCQLADLGECDLIFISVPTPMEPDGKCHLEMMESVVINLNKLIDKDKTFLVIRSNVLPGAILCQNF